MRMKFLKKEYQWIKIQSASHSPEAEIKCRPQAFWFDSVLPGFKTRARDRLLRPWIINEFLKHVFIYAEVFVDPALRWLDPVFFFFFGGGGVPYYF